MLKHRISRIRDDFRNRKNYAAVNKKIGRNWNDDIAGFDRCKVEMRMNKDTGENMIYIDDAMIAKLNFHQMAVLYHFMRKCIYR